MNMKLRKFSNEIVLLSFPLLMMACGGGEVAQESEADLVTRAQGIHDRVITLDTHDDINASNFTADLNYTMDLGNQVNLPKMEEGGLWPICHRRADIGMLSHPHCKIGS